MLLKVEPGGDGSEPSLKVMHIPNHPEMGLFQTAVEFPRDKSDSGKVIVTYNPPSPQDVQDAKPRETRQLEIPLRCSPALLDTRKKIQVVVKGSPTSGYDMGAEYNEWFSECFGYPVVLVYLGGNAREVLGTLAPEKRNRASWWTLWYDALLAFRDVPILLPLCWLCPLIGLLQKPITMMFKGRLTPQVALLTATAITMGWLWIAHHLLAKLRISRIGFSDCAPLLIISKTSVDNAWARFPEGVEMDHTKFRSNIVVSGAESAFEEDFWTELKVGPRGVRLQLTGNAARCHSLNVDYQTGKPAKGEAGTLLKKLMKDRRVDKGAKFSPIFGRYSFLHWTFREETIRVGDEAEVVARSKERTTIGMIRRDPSFFYR